MNSEIHGAAEFTGFFARRAETAQEFTVQVEHLYAPVSRIRYKDFIAGNGDARRVIELTWTITLAAPGGYELIRRLCRRGHKGNPSGKKDKQEQREDAGGYFQAESAHGNLEIEPDAAANNVVALKRCPVQILHEGELHARLDDPAGGDILQAEQAPKRCSSGIGI